MTDFPDGVYSPRTKENKDGVVYNPVNTKVGYAEDTTKLDDEVVAIENELGTTPSGAYETVKAWLTALTNAVITVFTDLDDTPANYTGEGGKVVAVNGTEDGLEFVTPSVGEPGGADTEVQFNDSGAFGGSSNMVWNDTLSQLLLRGSYDASNPALGIIGDVSTGIQQGQGGVGTLALMVSGNEIVQLRPSNSYFGDSSFRFNENKGDYDFIVNTDRDSNMLFIQGSNNRVGIGTGVPIAKMHIDQLSTTDAIPVLHLDQADISEEMISFETTIGTGNAIEAVGAKTLTTTHFIKVTLPGGLTRYIPAGTIA